MPLNRRYVGFEMCQNIVEPLPEPGSSLGGSKSLGTVCTGVFQFQFLTDFSNEGMKACRLSVLPTSKICSGCWIVSGKQILDASMRRVSRLQVCKAQPFRDRSQRSRSGRTTGDAHSACCSLESGLPGVAVALGITGF